MFLPLRIHKLPASPALLPGTLMIVLMLVHIIETLYPDLHLHQLLTGKSVQIDYAILTSTLVHADWMHLWGNLLFLYFFGNLVSRRIGNIPFLAVTIAASIMIGLIGVSMREVGIGASGIISGLMGAALAAYPTKRFYFVYLFGFSNGTFWIPLFWVVAFGLFIDITGLIYYGVTSSYYHNIRHWAHLVGFMVGYIIVYAGIRDQYINRTDCNEPSAIDIMRNIKLIAPQTSRTMDNMRLVNTWAIYMIFFTASVALGLYLHYHSAYVDPQLLSYIWIPATLLVLTGTAAIAMLVYEASVIYVIVFSIVCMTAINLAFNFSLLHRVDMFLTLLWLMQASSAKVYWPRLLKAKPKPEPLGLQ